MTKTHDILINELLLTGKGLLDATAGLSLAQWEHLPGPDRWSIGLTTEHLAVVEKGVHAVLTTRLLNSPLSEDQVATYKSRDVLVARAMFDRSSPLVAPTEMVPRGRWPDPQEARNVFEETRKAVVGWFSETRADLRRYWLPHPILGDLDGKQWLLFLAAHTARHTRQIVEIKASPGYPAA
jgi:hypothetical protein